MCGTARHFASNVDRRVIKVTVLLALDPPPRVTTGVKLNERHRSPLAQLSSDTPRANWGVWMAMRWTTRKHRPGVPFARLSGGPLCEAIQELVDAIQGPKHALQTVNEKRLVPVALTVEGLLHFLLVD